MGLSGELASPKYVACLIAVDTFYLQSIKNIQKVKYYINIFTRKICIEE